MKKVAYIPATILETLCLARTWTVQFFAHAKMGMARYVIYKSRGWESRHPMEPLAKKAALMMALLTATLLPCFLRQKRNLTKALRVIGTDVVPPASGYAVSTWINSIDESRAYYFVNTILGAVPLIQYIRT